MQMLCWRFTRGIAVADTKRGLQEGGWDGIHGEILSIMPTDTALQICVWDINLVFIPFIGGCSVRSRRWWSSEWDGAVQAHQHDHR